MVSELDDRLDRRLKGKKLLAAHAAMGLHTVGDLLRRPPRRYVQLTELTDLADLPVGEEVTVAAEVVSVEVRKMQHRKGTVTEVLVTDGTRELSLTFFNQPWRKAQLPRGLRAAFSGKAGTFRGRLQLTHPQIELLDDDDEESGRARAGGRRVADDGVEDGGGQERPLPIYALAKELRQTDARRAVWGLLDTLGHVPDPLPADVRTRHGLLGLRETFVALHRPSDDEDHERAEHRLRWEEAFVLQVELARRRAVARALPAIPRRSISGGLAEQFDERLPFTLTDGQRVLGEVIAAELAGDHPMHRLLQGEVGAGKTVVALRAMLDVVDASGQAALLAPTEVLAQQHHRSITAMLGPLAEAGLLGGADVSTKVVLLTGSLSAAARRQALLDVAGGAAGIVVGTHALLEERVEFADLGLVVVDEQHRFGVEQRDLLRGKAASPPHVLVMTATPIPRTIAMTVFGDLDISTLAEQPAGRAGVDTYVVPATDKPRFLERAWERVREEVDAGHQAFVVCAQISVDEAVEDADPLPGPPTRAVLELLPELANGPLSGLRLEMLHGRMPAEVKDDVMQRFAAGAIDVLVATTVVEVGVDVPNATAMVIMDAHRFGVSQLHQLRGRVARGSSRGVCLLVTDAPEETPGRHRIDQVAATTDGFVLAEVDLRQRREGDVLGASQ
ncbi:MAG: ATP-dependent DNA helicase RecG, partial [Actinomycetes bacterium]